MIKLTLDKLLTEREITRYKLAKMTNIKYQTIDSYYKNKVVRYDSFILAKICEALECDISELMTNVK